MELGSALVVFLRCEGSSSEDFSASRSEFPSAKEKGLGHIFVLSAAEVLPRNANIELNVHHDAPALRGECYPLQIELISHEKEIIRNIVLSVTTNNQARIHDQPKIDNSSSIQLQNDQITPGQIFCWNVFTQMDQPGKHIFTFQVLKVYKKCLELS